MGDMGELFNELREEGRKKRANNLEWSTKYLKEQGVSFQSFNNGVHLRIQDIDFYPSTGLWKVGNIKRRGVKNLVKFIQTRNAMGGSIL